MIISVVLNWRQNCQTLISSMMSPSKRFLLIPKICNWLNSERGFKIGPNLRLLANLISPHEPDPSLEDNLAPFLTDSDACDVFAVAARNFLVFFFLVFFPRTKIISKVANKGNMTATFIFVLSVRYCQKPTWFAWISDSCIYSGTGSMDITTYKFAFADKNNK